MTIDNEATVNEHNIASMDCRSIVDVRNGNFVRYDFTVVLVQQENGYLCAYRGIGSREHAQLIARHGDPLTLKEAQGHFPIGLTENIYQL